MIALKFDVISVDFAWKVANILKLNPSFFMETLILDEFCIKVAYFEANRKVSALKDKSITDLLGLDIKSSNNLLKK